MSSVNPLAWLRRALDPLAGGLWAGLAWLLDVLQGAGPVTTGLAVLGLGALTLGTARLMQRRLIALLLADPRRIVRWRDLEVWFSLPGALWLPFHLVGKALAWLRELAGRVWRAKGGAGQPAGPVERPPAPEPLLVATLGPSFLLGGVIAAALYAALRLLELPLRFGLGLLPGAPAWQILLLGRRPELGMAFPLPGSPFVAGLLAVTFWSWVAWWAGRLVRLVYRKSLGGNRIADREDDAVLPLWRRWGGTVFLVRPADSYLAWARWPVLGALPLLAWAWLSLGGFPFRVEASELAVAFVLWTAWATHLSLAGFERLPAAEGEDEPPKAEAAGWPEVLAWLEAHHQVAPPVELDVPREVEPLHRADIPPGMEEVLSPLVLELLPGPRPKQPTHMQRAVLADLSLLAYVHLDPPVSRERLELRETADEALEDRSGLRKRHQVVLAPEGAGKTTLALLAVANHVLVHTRGALLVTRDEASEAALYRALREAVETTTLRWNVRVRRAGTDLMNDLSRGIVPDVVVMSVQRLTVDLLGNEEVFARFLGNLGLIVVDDVESFAGPVEVHAQLAFRRLGARVCGLLGVADLDQKGAPLVLLLGTDSMDDLPAWARSLCGIDAVTRDFTRTRAEAEERAAAEQAARGIPVRGDGLEEEDLQGYLQRVRQGRHHLFHRLRDFRTAAGDPLEAATLVAACEQLAVPWHYRPCGDGRRRLGRIPLLLRDEPRHHVERAEEACVVLLEGTWSEVRRERRRLRRAGARFSRYRRANGSAGAPEGAPRPEPIAFVTLADPDEEMAFTQLDRRFGLAEVLDRLPYPVLRAPSERIRELHLSADLVQHWAEVAEILAVYGPEAGGVLTRLSRAGVLLTDPFVDVHPEALRYERKLRVRALARALPPPHALASEVAAAPLPPAVADVEVVSPEVVEVRDRLRSLVLARVDAAAAAFLYYPGRILHDARGSYVVVSRAVSQEGQEGAAAGAGPPSVEVEPLLVDDLSSPRRRVRFVRPAAGPPAAAALGTGAPDEPAIGPEPLLVGELPLAVALLPVELESEHVATYRLGPVVHEIRQRQVLDTAQRAMRLDPALRTWALALYPNPDLPQTRVGEGKALTFDAARLIAAALRVVLRCMVRGGAGSLEVALRVDRERPAGTAPLGLWEGFFLFDLEWGGNGTARALHRDKVEELLRLCRLLLERVLDPSRLLALHDHWGDEEEILSEAGSADPQEGGGRRWQEARTGALVWLDSRLRPEGRAEGTQVAPGVFAGGSQPGEGDLIDIGRCWYSRDEAVTDLVWAKHRWRLPGGGEAMLDVGFDRETATGARGVLEEPALLALYPAAYEALVADEELLLADGTAWAAPRQAWRPGPEGRGAEPCGEAGAEAVKTYGALAWSLAAHGCGALGPLARVLRERSGTGAEGEAGRLALLSWLAHFVQGIPYSVPGALRGGLRPAVSTLLYRLGDCDSKSLLLALLARCCGIPAGLFVSFEEGHALAAVAAPDPLVPGPAVPMTEEEAPEGAAGEEEEPEEPESLAVAHLAAWSLRAGLPGPPCLWAEMPAAPGEAAVHLYVPVESTAYQPVGRVRVGRPATWVFLPLVALEQGLPTLGGHAVLRSDRAEHESRS